MCSYPLPAIDEFLGLPPGSEGVRQTLDGLVSLLVKWNRTYRLVGSTDAHELYDKHWVDVHALLACLVQAPSVRKIADLGAGAGLPTIPLKLCRPELDVVLVESQLRRINFCEQARRTLGIAGLSVVHGDASVSDVRRSVGLCDLVISRATWKMDQLFEIARPYCQSGGRIWALKAEVDADERALADEVAGRAGWSWRCIYRYQTPYTNRPRSVHECSEVRKSVFTCNGAGK